MSGSEVGCTVEESDRASRRRHAEGSPDDRDRFGVDLEETADEVAPS